MAYGSHSFTRSPSVSTSEGLDMKLTDSAMPTEDIYLPQSFQIVESRVLREPEYDFGCEQAFLGWTTDIQLKEEERLKELIRKRHQRLSAELDSAELNHKTHTNPPVANGPSQSANPPSSIVHPVMVGMGLDILQPTPTQEAKEISEDNETNTAEQKIDFSDFENVASDPFEITELQTIDDMEELKSVLENSAPNIRESSQQIAMDDNAAATDEENLEEMSDFTPRIVDYIPNGSVNSHIPIETQNNHHLNDVEENVDMCHSLPNSFNRSLEETELEMYSDRVQSYPTPVMLKHLPNFTNRTPLPSIQQSFTTESQDLESNGGNFQRNSSPVFNSDFSHVTSINSSCIPSSRQSEVISPPGYPQTLNRYSPLPSASQSSTSTEISTNGSPYLSLNEEDKQFVDTIVSMGFPKLRTTKAVKRLGQDQKLVFDLLCAMDRLCTKGYREERVERAMDLLDNDEKKVSDFLSLWEKIEELGFSVEDIKREFLVHGNDETKVLDALTTNS